MTDVKVVTYNEDGSVAFQATLNQEQLGFILQVGVNFLMANGAADFLTDEQDNTFEPPSTDTVQ